jgi:hypothetical protein
MVASAFGNIASMQGLRLENLRQRKREPLYHFAEVVFALRTFDREEEPNILGIILLKNTFRE